jgi:MOSC domain-containing protein
MRVGPESARRPADNGLVTIRLTELRRYPVKSCRGESLESAVVESWGLAGDRRWMVVDESGEAVTAREEPRLLLVHPAVDVDGTLRLRASDLPDLPDLEVPVPTGARVPVTVFRGPPFEAAPAADEAHAWFSEVLGQPVRLMYAEDPSRRAAGRSAPAGTPMAFADGYPLLLTSEESLADLNARIAAGPRAAEGELPMVRFRPNLVVAGAPAYAEDGWARFRIGAATFLGVKGCARCAIPTTDHLSAVRYKEPTATLARYRRWDGAVWFAMNLVPETPGATLHVGDEVELIDVVPTPDGPPRGPARRRAAGVDVSR